MYKQENGLDTPKPMQRSYRHELRALTRADHARLDDLFSALDITRRVDYARFIGVHLAVFEVLRPHLSPAGLTRPQLLAGLACLQRDLATLGQRRLETQARHGEADGLEPLAVDYVVAGSRLGLKVLQAHRAGSADPLVRAAGAYFTQPNAASPWPKVCRALSKVPVDSARASAITRDTRRIFNLFAAAYGSAARVKGVSEITSQISITGQELQKALSSKGNPRTENIKGSLI